VRVCWMIAGRVKKPRERLHHLLAFLDQPFRDCACLRAGALPMTLNTCSRRSCWLGPRNSREPLTAGWTLAPDITAREAGPLAGRLPLGVATLIPFAVKVPLYTAKDT
jgi:hypothetical protein